MNSKPAIRMPKLAHQGIQSGNGKGDVILWF